MILKPQTHRSPELLRSAKGEACTLLFPGVDNHDPATVVWCHSPFIEDGKGKGLKGHDFIGAMGCQQCHDLLDQRVRRSDITFAVRQLHFLLGFKASMRRVFERGIKIW